MIGWHGGRPILIRWNNVPYHAGRTVFLLNGKCGNTSVKAAVLEAEGHAAERPHRVADRWSPARAARSGYRAVAVVRNPYARAVSIWHAKIRQGNNRVLMGKAPFTRDMGFVTSCACWTG